MRFELIKFRPYKKGKYLVYFNELRKLVIVNSVGVEILNKFFNQGYSIEKISKESNIKTKDIKKFFQELQEELIFRPRGGSHLYKKLIDVPISAEIEITRQCNLRCKHCCIKSYDKVMPLSEIKHILSILHRKNVFEIALGGGEPFTHPDIMEIITLCCKKYNFATIITTNGTLLNKKVIKKLSEFKNNLALVVSLEGIGEMNDKIRGEGTFQKVNKIIRELIRNKIYTEITVTLTKLNLTHWTKIIKYSNSLDIPCNFLLFKPFKQSHRSLIIAPDEYFNFIEKVFIKKRLERLKINLPNAESIFAYLDGQKQNECTSIMCSLIIDVEGNTVPCFPLQAAGYYTRRELPKFDENFVEKWKNHPCFKELRKGNLKECQARSFIFTKNIKGKDPYGVNNFIKYQKIKN